MLADRLAQCRHENNHIEVGTHWQGRAIGLGDVILVTRLIGELHRRYPTENIVARVPTHPEVFDNNPHVAGVSIGSGNLNDEGSSEGHYIDALCRWFDIDLPSSDIRGELYVTEKERQDALRVLNTDKPIVVVHIGDPTRTDPKVFTSFSSDSYVLVQVDQPYYRYPTLLVPEIPGALQTFRTLGVRELFALLSMSSLFVGVNSGPMHVAASFSIPSVIYANPFYNERMLYAYNDNLDSLNTFGRRVSEFLSVEV